MDCPTRTTLVNHDAASSMDMCEASHLNGVIVCTVGEDGTVLARLPDESEVEIPRDAVNRSQVLQDAVEAADCGVSFDLPAREGCAWLECLRKLSADPSELRATLGSTVVQFMQAADYFRDRGMLQALRTLVDDRLFDRAALQASHGAHREHQIQVCGDLGHDLTVAVLKASPHAVDFQIENLPEALHAYAVHAAFPDILGHHSVTLDCAQHCILTTIAVLRVLRSLPRIAHLGLFGSTTAIRTPDTPVLAEFYNQLELTLRHTNLGSLSIHAESNPCVIACWSTFLKALVDAKSIRKLSLESIPSPVTRQGDIALSRAEGMARDLAQHLSKLTTLTSLHMDNSCTIETTGCESRVWHAIACLPQLSELRIDTGETPDLVGLLSNSAPEMRFSNSAFEILPVITATHNLRALQVDVNHVNARQAETFSRALGGLSQLTELRLGHVHGRRQFPGGSFHDIVGEALDHLENLQELHFRMKAGSVSRDCLVSSNPECSALRSGLGRMRCLQALSVTFDCDQLHPSAVGNVLRVLSVAGKWGLTSLVLTLQQYTVLNSECEILSALGQLNALKRLSVRLDSPQKLKDTYPVLDLGALSKLTQLCVGYEERGTWADPGDPGPPLGVSLVDIRRLGGLEELSLEGRFLARPVRDVFTELGHCTALRSLSLVRVTFPAGDRLEVCVAAALERLVGLTELCMNDVHVHEVAAQRAQGGVVSGDTVLALKALTNLQKLTVRVDEMASKVALGLATSLPHLQPSLVYLDLHINLFGSFVAANQEGPFTAGEPVPEIAGVLASVAKLTSLRHLDISSVHVGSQKVEDAISSFRGMVDLEWLGVPCYKDTGLCHHTGLLENAMVADGREARELAHRKPDPSSFMGALTGLRKLKCLKIDLVIAQIPLVGMPYLLSGSPSIREVWLGWHSPEITDAESLSIQEVLSEDPMRCRDLLVSTREAMITNEQRRRLGADQPNFFTQLLAEHRDFMLVGDGMQSSDDE